MAKSSQPDRKRGDRRDRRNREPSEFAEATLSVDRVTRVVKGGRRMRFRAIVVVGNKKGKVGLGTGKASEVQAAVKKATSSAKRAMIRIPIVKGTIPHQVEMKFKAAKIRLLPAMEGTGIIAGGALRVILDHAGVKNVLSKRYGTRNKLVNAQATMLALERLKIPAGGLTEEVEEKVVMVDGKPTKVKTAEGKGRSAMADDGEEPPEVRLGGLNVQEIGSVELEKRLKEQGHRESK